MPDIERERFYNYFTRTYTDVVNNKEAPWYKKGIPEREVSYNPVSGVIFNGVNSVLLEMEAAKKGFRDSRWITGKEAERLGLETRYGEKPTPVMYINKYVHPTDVNPVTGKVFNPGENKEVFYVYNVEQFKANPFMLEKPKTFSFQNIMDKTHNLLSNTRVEDLDEAITMVGGMNSQASPLKKFSKTLTEYRLCQELNLEYKPPIPMKELQTELLFNKDKEAVIRSAYNSEVGKTRALNKDQVLEVGRTRTVERKRELSHDMSIAPF